MIFIPLHDEKNKANIFAGNDWRAASKICWIIRFVCIVKMCFYLTLSVNCCSSHSSPVEVSKTRLNKQQVSSSSAAQSLNGLIKSLATVFSCVWSLYLHKRLQLTGLNSRVSIRISIRAVVTVFKPSCFLLPVTVAGGLLFSLSEAGSAPVFCGFPSFTGSAFIRGPRGSATPSPRACTSVWPWCSPSCHQTPRGPPSLGGRRTPPADGGKRGTSWPKKLNL